MPSSLPQQFRLVVPSIATIFALMSSQVSLLAAEEIMPAHAEVEYAQVADRSLHLDIYQPRQTDSPSHPLIVWVHGGAWRSGSKEDVPIKPMLEHGFAVASVDYRLSPEAKFPAQVHDIKAAIRYLRANARKYGFDEKRFVIAGSSAGGHLAALVGISGGVEALEGTVGSFPDASSDVQAVVSFYGASNLESILSQSTEHGRSVRVPALKLLLGGETQEQPQLAKLASPIQHVDADDPPLWLIHGTADPQMPIEQSHELLRAYQHRGLPVRTQWIDGARHGGPEFYTQQRLENLSAELQASLRRPEPVRVLFAGSSSTYFNDLPGEVAKIVSGSLAEYPGTKVTAEIVGRSGSDIRVYSAPGFKDYQYGVKPGQTFLEKVRDERFDLVSLMVVCRFIMGDGDEEGEGTAHAEAVSRYCAAIRSAGGEPIFYEMGWGRGTREAEGRQRILELARKNNITYFSPCSTAWAMVYAERPDLALQHPNDSAHPGDLGHFLNLACFYATLTRTSPEGVLPRTFHVWPHLSREEKEERQEELRAAFQRFSPNQYQARLPAWMQKNAGAGQVGTISNEDALYLERIAWKAWREVERQLRDTP